MDVWFYLDYYRTCYWGGDIGVGFWYRKRCLLGRKEWEGKWGKYVKEFFGIVFLIIL